jgi:hypothetical protein
MRTIPVLPFLLLLVSAASCRTVQNGETSTRPLFPRTTVEVRNLKSADFNLYVLTGTHRLRLGTVPGMTTRLFVIPPHVVGERNVLYFAFDTLGAFGHATIGSPRRSISEDALLVRAGDQLALTVQ